MEKINVKVPLWKIRMEQRRKLEQRLNIVGGKIYNSTNQVLVLADVSEKDEILILNDYLCLNGEKFTENIVDNNQYDFKEPDAAFRLIGDLIKQEGICIPYMTIKAPWEIESCVYFLEEKGFSDEFISKFMSSNTRGISSNITQSSVIFKLSLTSIKELNKVFNFASVMSLRSFGKGCHLLWSVEEIENNQFKTSLGKVNGIDGIKNLLNSFLPSFNDVWLWFRGKECGSSDNLLNKNRLLKIQ